MISSSAADLIRRLWWQKAKGMTWRDIALDFPGVTFQELNKIALHGVLPKDKAILRALGMGRKRRERPQSEEAIIAMSMMTRQGLRLWKRRKQ